MRVIVSSSSSNLELKPVGILEVKLVQAKSLTNKDLIGKSDPYAVLFVRPLRDRTKTSKVMVRQLFFFQWKLHLHSFIIYLIIVVCDCNQTAGRVQNNQLNPVWNEHFEFTIEDTATQHLTIRIFDDEGIQASELIGCAQVSLKDLEPGKVKDVWLKLVKDLEVHRDNKYRGEVIGIESGLFFNTCSLCFLVLYSVSAVF